jgi:hypothetical protein
LHFSDLLEMPSTKLKNTLGYNIDSIVSRLIDKEVHKRLSGATIQDRRLMNMLCDKEITLKDIEERSHNLFNESFIDFLKDKHSASHFAVHKNYLVCFFRRKQIVAFDSVGYPSRSPRHFVIKMYAKDIIDLYDKTPKYKKLHLYPVVDDKIAEIVGFIIKRVAFLDMIEFTSDMKYKALEMRHSSNEGQKTVESDMYDLVKYYGQKIGLELKHEEEEIRNDFKLK